MSDETSPQTSNSPNGVVRSQSETVGDDIELIQTNKTNSSSTKSPENETEIKIETKEEEEKEKEKEEIDQFRGHGTINVQSKHSGIPGATMNFVNSIVGAGIIGLPYALYHSGFVLGIFLLLFGTKLKLK